MKKLHLLPAWVKAAGVLLVFAYLVISLLHNQAAITARRRELQEVEQQLSSQQAVNQELTRALADDEDAIIERIAREQGYAQPNERIFIGY